MVTTLKHQKSPKWLRINKIDLYQSDKDALTDNQWLNDQHMSVAQTLIKQQYPHISGLMPTIIQGRNPLPKDSLQILHTDGDHWVAVSMFDTGDEDIVVYDSKYSSLSPSTQALLAKLVHTDKPTFTVKLANVTKQSGASDCGLYAIAYLIHIASGLNPSVVIFEQAKMRKHLIKCFEQKNIEPFPVIKERRMSIYPKTITIKVYCYCRSVYDGQKIVECNGVCGEWYHTKCISTSIHRNKEWFCKNCSV